MEASQIRFILVTALISVLVLLELLFPYRKRQLKRLERWPGNLLLSLTSVLLIKLMGPISALGISQFAQKSGFGLLNYLNMNNLTISILSFVVLDFAIYYQHVLSHKWSFLWRLHRVHHADPDLDFTSGIRFHPLEIIFSQFYKILIIGLLGIQFDVVLIFEITLNAMALFNHSNFNIPHGFEKYLRYFIVTPQMHIIHHSVHRNDRDSNYGFNLSIWDHLCKSYHDRFELNAKIGLKYAYKSEDQHILNLIRLPFLNLNKES